MSLPLESIASKCWSQDWSPGPLPEGIDMSQASEKKLKDNLGPDPGGQQRPNWKVAFMEERQEEKGLPAEGNTTTEMF